MAYIRCSEETHGELKIAAAQAHISMQTLAARVWSEHKRWAQFSPETRAYMEKVGSILTERPEAEWSRGLRVTIDGILDHLQPKEKKSLKRGQKAS